MQLLSLTQFSFALQNPPPQMRKNWGELNGRSGKLARVCLDKSGMCASVFTAVNLDDAGDNLDLAGTRVQSTKQDHRFENNVRLGVQLRTLVK